MIHTDTIAAIATAMGNSGIGIVRISGQEAVAVADRIFKEKGKQETLEGSPSHTIHYGYIYDGDQVVDEVLVMLMRGPRSFTAEDTVEIDCHGGMLVTRRILETVLKAGARLAEPGEFTKRAFLNGRIDNHVTNRLEINADRETVQKVMNFLKGKTDDDNTPCYIDFNNIIPMPEELLIEKSSSGDLGMKYLEAMQLKPFYFLLDDDALRTIQWIEGLAEKDRKEALQLGASYLENRKKYGYPTWYEWSTATWGTKWNAYHQDFEEPNILWFDTAWNGVPLLIQKLSEIFPDVEFHYAYADEDLGFNTGRGTARNGEINMTIPEGRSNEAFEIMFFVKPGMDEYFELTDEGYKWVS